MNGNELKLYDRVRMAIINICNGNERMIDTVEKNNERKN